MKCPKCGGNAELSNWGSYIDPDYADFHVECEKCGYHSMGSTDPQKAKEMFEKEMGMYYTNGQWLKQANTEQLAEEIVKMTLLDKYKLYDRMESAEYDIGIGVGAKKVIVEWLKQPHTIKE